MLLRRTTKAGFWPPTQTIETLRARLYAGVSTLAQQTLPYRCALCATIGNEPRLDRRHASEGSGSDVAQREQRQQLIHAERRREIDVVLVCLLDRRGRSLLELVTTLQELTSLSVGFVSLSEALNLTTSTGRAMAGRSRICSIWQLAQSRLVQNAGLSLRILRRKVARLRLLGRLRFTAPPWHKNKLPIPQEQNPRRRWPCRNTRPHHTCPLLVSFPRPSVPGSRKQLAPEADLESEVP